MEEVEDWVGYVRWTRGRFAGYEEEIVVQATDEADAARKIRRDVVTNYPDPNFAKIVRVEPGRGTLETGI